MINKKLIEVALLLDAINAASAWPAPSHPARGKEPGALLTPEAEP